jgi:hypothetical protein
MKKKRKSKLTLSVEKQKQIKALADAMVRFIEWQENQMRLKHEARIRRMIKAQLNVRMNGKGSLPD